MALNPEKLGMLADFKLDSGKHINLKEGACVMEMVSYLADEPWSDHPPCACPILTGYAIALNDHFNDEHRQRLKEFIPLLVGTRMTDEVQIARKRLIRWRHVTATYPIILETLNLNDLAECLRKFQNTLESMAQAKVFIETYSEFPSMTWKANAYAYAYADTYADDALYAYAHGYTDGLHIKLADVALQTLRLAIEVR